MTRVIILLAAAFIVVTAVTALIILSAPLLAGALVLVLFIGSFGLPAKLRKLGANKEDGTKVPWYDVDLSVDPNNKPRI